MKVQLQGGTYQIYRYKGKQVRDNIHSYDVATAIDGFYRNPRVAEVYNLGGGRANSCSILEAFQIVELLTGKKMKYQYREQPREGDHICYISNLARFQSHYPEWTIMRLLNDIFVDIVKAWHERLKS